MLLVLVALVWVLQLCFCERTGWVACRRWRWPLQQPASSPNAAVVVGVRSRHVAARRNALHQQQFHGSHRRERVAAKVVKGEAAEILVCRARSTGFELRQPYNQSLRELCCLAREMKGEHPAVICLFHTALFVQEP